MLVLTHKPSQKMANCQLTFKDRESIDISLALTQFQAYGDMLRHLGATVRVLNVNEDEPDACFIEDTAVVLDELAVLCSMGTSARRAEPTGIEAELRAYREVQRLPETAKLEGGDVLRVGRTLFVGLSTRTNREGITALEVLVRPYGYRVIPVPVHGCLHLKTACTALPDGCLLVNPAWVDLRPLLPFPQVCVPEEEPGAANVLLLGETACLKTEHPETSELVRRRGFVVESVDLSEFTKAEGGMTCLSLLIDLSL